MIGVRPTLEYGKPRRQILTYSAQDWLDTSAGELSAFLGDRDPTETSEAGTTDLRPTGAVQTVILSPLHQRILEVLEGKALRKDALVDACGCGKLYKPSASGIRPLQKLRGAIVNC